MAQGRARVEMKLNETDFMKSLNIKFILINKTQNLTFLIFIKSMLYICIVFSKAIFL